MKVSGTLGVYQHMPFFESGANLSSYFALSFFTMPRVEFMNCFIGKIIWQTGFFKLGSVLQLFSGRAKTWCELLL